MNENISLVFQNIQKKQAIIELKSCNELTIKYGLVLSDVDINELVEYRFKSLENTGRIEFEEGSRLETIGDYAFEWCGITEIIIPASVTTIGWDAFYNCENLTKVVFEDIYGWYSVEGEIPYAVFADQGAFAAIFRKEVGCTPSQYRQKKKEDL